MEEKDLYCCYLIKLNKMEIVGALFDLKSTLQYVSYTIFFLSNKQIILYQHLQTFVLKRECVQKWEPSQDLLWDLLSGWWMSGSWFFRGGLYADVPRCANFCTDTNTYKKWKQSVQVMCALNSYLLLYLKYLTYKLRPFQCWNSDSAFNRNQIWKSCS